MLSIREYLRRFFAWDYALTFWTIIIVFVVPVLPQKYIGLVTQIVYSIVYVLAALTVLSFSKKILYFGIGLFVLEWISGLLKLEIINGLSNLLGILFFIFIVIIFVARIAKSDQVNIKVILEGINGYLLLVLVFTFFMRILIRINPASFTYSLAVDNGFSLSDMLYFSVVTMTTLGYGDFLPATPLAKSLSTLIAVTGQFYIAILVAMLVGKYIAQNESNKR